MIIPNPQNGGRWKVAYPGDKFGDIVETRNLDFNKEGSVRCARHPMCWYTNGTDADFDKPVAIASLDGTYFIVTTDGTFSLTIGNGSPTFTELTTSSAPTEFAGSDAVPYLDALAVSGTTMVHSYDVGGGAWTSRITGMSSSYPHPMAVSPTLRTLFVADHNVVYQTNSGAWTDDGTNRLTIPAEFIITGLRWIGTDLHIATRHQDGGEALLYVWNGSGTQAQGAFSAQADWIYAMCEYDSSNVVLTSEGQLLRFTGAGFTELANLPIYYTDRSWYSSASTSNYGKCVNRGMMAAGDVLYFNIDASTNPGGDYVPSMPSGLWCYDPKVGPYHKGGYNVNRYRLLTISALNSNVFTTGTHGAETGDAVFTHSISNLTPATNKTYYVIKESSTQMKLALSREDAIDGRHVTFTGTPSGDTLICDNLDFIGDVYDDGHDPGPVFVLGKSRPDLFFGAEVLYAGRCTDSNASTIMSLGGGRNVGYFVTPKIYSSQIEDITKSLYLKLEPLFLDTEEIIIKYRTKEREGLLMPDGIDLVWVDSTSFTVTFNTQNVRDVMIGDEVSFIKGRGAGHLRKITGISEGASTWTITIDEAIPNVSASDTSTAIVENWTEITSFTNDNTDTGVAKTPVASTSGWIQFKVEMRGHTPEVSEMQLASTVHKPTT